jgi:acetylornithine deacetylase
MSEPKASNCLKLLQGMVRIDSINATISQRPHPEAELAAYLERQAMQWGLPTRRLPVGEAYTGNVAEASAEGSYDLLVWHQVSPSAPWLLFESHLDTVGVAGMTVDPFGAQVEDGRIYGRGACDTKGSGAAMLWALKEYARKTAGRNNIALLYAVDEEALKHGVEGFTERHLPMLGWWPVGAIVGEPTELQPVVAHNGVVRWSVQTHGLAAHSSDPTKGLSAISMMVRVIQALEDHYIARLNASHPLVGPARCSINIIHGGTAVNIIPDLCEIVMDRRVVPGEDPDQVLPEVRRVLEELRAEMPMLAYSLSEPLIVDPPLDPKGGEALFVAVQRTLASLGLPTELKGVPYGTDGSNLGASGIPVVVLGPGHIARAHTVDEYLELEQLERAIEVYGALMDMPILTEG